MRLSPPAALLLAAALAAPPLPAQLPPAATAAVAAPGVPQAATRGPRDPAELEAFLDGLMTAWMRDKHVAGITISVVRDGRVLLAKGYGFADVAKRDRKSTRLNSSH